MGDAKLSRSQIGRLAAGKAWFNMTSEGGRRFVQGTRPLYANLFRFVNRHDARKRWKVIYRPGITLGRALAAIGDDRLHQSRVSRVVKRFKEKMALREGAMLQRLIKAYVRDPDARRQCIERYGAKCSVCQFSFKARYGQVAEGFIHVHHVRPLSTIRKDHKIDPVKDLRPVCPNCHAVLHLKNPAFSIEKVKSFLRP